MTQIQILDICVRDQVKRCTNFGIQVFVDLAEVCNRALVTSNFNQNSGFSNLTV